MDELKEWEIFSLLYAVALITHIIFIPMFWLLGSVEMMWFNVGSVLLWSVTSLLLHRRRVIIAHTLSGLEIVAHGVVASYFLGMESGFRLWPMLLFIVAFFLQGKPRMKMFMIACPIIGLLIIQQHLPPPAAPLSAGTTHLMQTINLLFMSGVVALGMFFFSYRVNALEAALRAEHATQQALQLELEQVLAERTAQVDELATLLSQKVVDRSRALARALEQVSGEALAPGHVIDDRVEVIRLLGRGGMGAVYLGTDLRSGRQVAVKLMFAGLASPSAIRRFLAEAELVNRIRDPAIVQTKHIDVSDEGMLYQVMEYVEGVSMERRLSQGPFELADGLRLGASIARALGVAHAAGVIHRDIKPANIMLTTTAPGVRVLDFGISRFAERDEESKMTGTHQIMGTPAYMAPEQISNTREVTFATDLYSFGVMLFELLTGALPVQGESVAALFAEHLSGTPRPIKSLRADVPDPVAAALDACLSKSPRDRPDAMALHETLSASADALGAPSPEVVNQRSADTLPGPHQDPRAAQTPAREHGLAALDETQAAPSRRTALDDTQAPPRGLSGS